MSGLVSNLVAEAIGLVVGLFVIYLIVEKLLRRQEKRTWEPARKSLLSALKRHCEGAFIGWARHTVPPRLEAKDVANLSGDLMNQLVSDLEKEIQELRSVPDNQIYDQRPEKHWRGQVRALSTLKESLRLAVDRAQLTLRDDPELVQSIADLEGAFMPIPGLDDQLRILERLGNDGSMSRILDEVIAKELTVGALAVVRVYERFLKLWRQLSDIPGAVS